MALDYLVILWLEGRVWLLNIVLYLLMVGLQDVCVVVREMPEQAQGAVLQAQGGGGRRGRGVAPVQQLAHAAQTTQRGLYTLHTKLVVQLIYLHKCRFTETLVKFF